MPKISTIMSVYNAERYLSKSIESILKQTLDDFEFIVVNDGSTDRSSVILEYYVSQDSRIRLINQENKGLTKSLNKALALATGDYIARMDADDISMPERFELQLDFLENNPSCVAVSSDVLQIDLDGDPISRMGVLLSHAEIEAELLKGKGGVLRHPAVLMRSEALIAIDGYRDSYTTAQDLDLFLRLTEKGQLANLPDVLLEYRLHLESVNFSRYQRQTTDVIAILSDAYKARDLEMPKGLFKERSKERDSNACQQAWARMALGAGNLSTARKHAFQSLWNSPFSHKSWEVLLRTLKKSTSWRSLLYSTAVP